LTEKSYAGILTDITMERQNMNDEQNTQLTVASPMDLIAQLAEQQELVQQEESAGYASAYARVLHPSSDGSPQFPTGTLQVSLSREEKKYAQVLAVYPVDVIGTSGEWDSRNPTPRNWQTSFTDSEAQRKYGYSVCRSSNGLTPDPAYHGREIMHPGANGRTVVTAAAGYNSDKLVDVPTNIIIGPNLSCKECPYSKAWFPPQQEGVKSTPLLNQVCRANPTGVFYLVGMLGDGMLADDQRKLLQIPMYKQATRTMFSRGSDHNDTAYQKQVGISIPLADIIKSKPVNGVPAYGVKVDEWNAIFLFPMLAGGILHKEAKGYSAHPFVFNPAVVIREYMRTSSESDLQLRFRNAIKQAVEKFADHIKGQVQDAAHFKEQVMALLAKTMSTTMEPDSMLLAEEFIQVYTEYHKEDNGAKVGRVALTTPFQATSVPLPPPMVSVESTSVGDVAPSVPGVDPEVLSKQLQLLENATFNFNDDDEDETDTPSVSDTSSPLGFFDVTWE
jgi:hypothetical protein